MTTFINSLLALRSDRRAVTALEYGLIAALIAGVCITAVTVLGTSISGSFNTIATNLAATTK
jgi:pilus assembly protein Flp/PilA